MTPDQVRGRLAGTTSKKYLHADARGSIIALTDASGNVVAKNTYDPYGEPDAGNTGLFQYTGQIWLAEAGLYHYKARAYHPGLGRFLQTDPIGFVFSFCAPSRAGGMNIYAYAGNDPVNATDPSGLTPSDEVVSYGTRHRQDWGFVYAPVGGYATPGFSGGGSGESGGGGGGGGRGDSTNLCVTPTGSHIPSCVTVDVNLTPVQESQLETAFRDFILANPGAILNGFGKTVTGANAANVAFASAVSQFVGYAISHSGDLKLQAAWAYVKRIVLLGISNPDAGPRTLRGETFFMGDARTVTDILSLDFGTIRLYDEAFSPQNNLAETLIHETLHLHTNYLRYNKNAISHEQLFFDARAYCRQFGLC